jgi:hypothetical protein
MKRIASKMSGSHLGRDATMPSTQHTDTERTPLSGLITQSTPAVSNEPTSSLSGARDTDDEHSYVTKSSAGHDSSFDQADLAGLSPESRVVYGKTACQTCVSRTTVRCMMPEAFC